MGVDDDESLESSCASSGPPCGPAVASGRRSACCRPSRGLACTACAACKWCASRSGCNRSSALSLRGGGGDGAAAAATGCLMRMSPELRRGAPCRGGGTLAVRDGCGGEEPASDDGGESPGVSPATSMRRPGELALRSPAAASGRMNGSLLSMPPPDEWVRKAQTEVERPVAGSSHQKDLLISIHTAVTKVPVSVCMHNTSGSPPPGGGAAAPLEASHAHTHVYVSSHRRPAAPAPHQRSPTLYPEAAAHPPTRRASTSIRYLHMSTHAASPAAPHGRARACCPPAPPPCTFSSPRPLRRLAPIASGRRG